MELRVGSVFCEVLGYCLERRMGLLYKESGGVGCGFSCGCL